MGISHSTAKIIAPASFLYNVAAQNYGMFSNPNMKTIHDRNLSFFSPQPWFIASFFAPQMVLQVAWMYKLLRADPSKSDVDRRETQQMIDYVPAFAIGGLSIGTWMFFWNAEKLAVANVFVILNTFTQLYHMIARLDRMDPSKSTSVLTHVVSKTFAGIGVLDILHNTSVAYFKDASPSLLVKILTGVGFGLGSAMSDWIFGGCLVYDLVALAVGQSTYMKGTNWPTLLGVYAAGSAAIIGAKNYLK